MEFFWYKKKRSSSPFSVSQEFGVAKKRGYDIVEISSFIVECDIIRNCEQQQQQQKQEEELTCLLFQI